MSNTIARGRISGMFSAIGVCTGAMIHAIAAGIGLSAILTASAHAFTIVKWVGALYLIFLGYKAIRGTLQNKENISSSYLQADLDKPNFGKIIYQGILVDLLNPKTALFFLAFIPQFVNPSPGSDVWQFIFLGLVVIINALIIEFFLIVFASKITRYLRTKRTLSVWLERSFGTILIGLGLHLIKDKG